jgi:DNA-binding CsgD family transcriptional regulator
MHLSQTEEFFHVLDRVKSAADVLSVLQAFIAPDRVSGIFIARLPTTNENIAPNILLRGWNELWIEEYARKNYQRDDPIAKELTRRNSPYGWSEVCRSRKLTVAEHSLMSAARAAGLKNGLTIPVLDANLRTVCISLSIAESYDEDCFDREGRHALQTVASITVAKLESLSPLQPERILLSLAPREIQCLTLAGSGLTSRQIERQTGLSFRTIDFYIGRAMQKLNASNRTEAVQIAQRHRLIMS